MPNFFISYRRSDQEGQYLAHMIFRELRRRYGEQSVFLDVDSRSPGLSFPMKVEQALRVTDVVLVIIGPTWLQLLTERLEDSRDWVRYEVAESLKRSWLPVVPVCKAGVEMPRPHQLPEDLKDLGWRDGVTLDPFQDFDSQLARLLSDVEHVLEMTRREKEKLHLARRKVIALLQWRAHQLELAEKQAATRDAVVGLAAEKAAKERALKEELDAHWTAAATAAQVAREKAAAEKRAGARASAGQEKAVKTLGPKYYRSSGRFTISAVILSFLVIELAIFALAFGYSYSLLSLPFVQGNFILTFLFGTLSGAAAGFTLRWRRVRNTRVAALEGLSAGLSAVYLSWAVWFRGHQGVFKAKGFIGLLDLVFSPVRLWHIFLSINGTSWDLWGYKPSADVLLILWSLEAALIIGLSSLVCAFMVDDAVFCEACGTWCQLQLGVAKLRSCDPAELKRRLETKDLAFLEALGSPPSRANQWLNLRLWQCKKCGTTNTLDVEEATVTAKLSGRRSTTVARLLSRLLVTTPECAEIQRIGREAASRRTVPQRHRPDNGSRSSGQD